MPRPQVDAELHLLSANRAFAVTLLVTAALLSPFTVCLMGLFFQLPAIPFSGSVKCQVSSREHRCDGVLLAFRSAVTMSDTKKSKKQKSVEQVEEKPKKDKKRKAEAAEVDGTSSSKKPKKEKKQKKAKSESSDEPEATPAAAPPSPGDPNALDNFQLSESIKSLLRSKGIETLFAIQAACFDVVLDGNDVVGRARTGCGKTLAFVLPIVQVLSDSADGSGRRPFGRPPAVIVLAPTRELAKQVGITSTGGCTALTASLGILLWAQK